MARKYDWKRRTELLMQEVGRFLAYKMANDGATTATLSTRRRGEKLFMEWRSNPRRQWSSLRIMNPHGRDVYLELKHGVKLTVADWTLYKGDWKKLFKQIERTIANHLVEEWAIEILQCADDNYNWDCTCVTS